jgi:2',3'-cyclic-nucleotide 2'-phosphodiesterase (5'-nucleotidase family)
MPVLHVLHTNDLHNHLTPRAAAFIREVKAGFQPGVLLLDAGDAVGAGNLGARKQEPILSLMWEAGYDAMAMGNRETHPTRAALSTKLRDARVPVLAANLRAKQDRPAPRIVQEYLDFAIPADDEDAIISVFGLAPQITAPDSWWARVTDYVFDDPAKTGLGLARKLREGADLVIALTHIGYEQDVALAASPHIDLIIGGHSHRVICPPEHPGHAYLVSAGAHGEHLGHLTITWAPDAGITEIVGEMIALPGA